MSSSEYERYEVILHEDENGDLILPFPLPLLKKMGWKEGDELSISFDEKGNLFFKKE